MRSGGAERLRKERNPEIEKRRKIASELWTETPEIEAETRRAMAPRTALSHAGHAVDVVSEVSDAATSHVPFTAASFAEARTTPLPRCLHDNFIDMWMADSSRLNPALHDQHLEGKAALDKAKLSPRDEQLAHDPSHVKAFRNKMTALIMANMKIWFDPKDQPIFEQSFAALRARMETDQPIYAALVDFVDDAVRRTGKMPSLDAMKSHLAQRCNYHGKLVDLVQRSGNDFGQSGKDTDWLNGSFEYTVNKATKRVSVPISMQRQIGGTFVFFKTVAYLKRSATEGHRRATQRIYLNPVSDMSIEVFSQLFDALNKAGIACSAKINDMSSDILRWDSDAKKRAKADKIVVYLENTADAETALTIAKSIYEKNLGAFEGQGSPSAAFELAAGFAIGDEPAQKGESLASSRGDLLDKTRWATRQRINAEGGASQERLRTVFREEFVRVAQELRINPNNISFNA